MGDIHAHKDHALRRKVVQEVGADGLRGEVAHRPLEGASLLTRSEDVQLASSNNPTNGPRL